jgi:hypothetical protein
VFNAESCLPTFMPYFCHVPLLRLPPLQALHPARQAGGCWGVARAVR